MTANKWMILVLIVFVGLLTVLAMSGNKDAGATAPSTHDPRATDRLAIELCRKNQNDELQELSTRRFMRTVCDKMAADFQVKYGVPAE